MDDTEDLTRPFLAVGVEMPGVTYTTYEPPIPPPKRRKADAAVGPDDVHSTRSVATSVEGLVTTERAVEARPPRCNVGTDCRTYSTVTASTDYAPPAGRSVGVATEETPDIIHAPSFACIKHHALAFGIFIGFFVECGALAAHLLYQGTHWSSHRPSTTEIAAFSLAWATLTSLLPCMALVMLRSLLVLAHRSVHGNNVSVAMADIIWHVESRFGIGSFVGVSLSALVTDSFFGFHRHATMSALVLATIVLSFLFLHGSQPPSAKQPPVLRGKVLDAVDPSSMTSVELKEGSLMMV